MLAVLPTRKIVVSSAKRTVRPGGRTLGRSFMKSEKRVGPRTESFGTPEVVDPGEGVELNTRVTWKLHEFFNSKYLFNTRKKIIAQYNKWWVQTTTRVTTSATFSLLEQNDIFLLLIYRVRRRGNLSLTRRTRTLSSWSTAANKTR